MSKTIAHLAIALDFMFVDSIIRKTNHHQRYYFISIIMLVGVILVDLINLPNFTTTIVVVVINYLHLIDLRMKSQFNFK